MTWTAIVGESTLTRDAVETAVFVTDSVSTKFTQRYVTDGSAAALREQVRATIGAQESRKSVAIAAPGTVLDLSDDPPPTPPTKEEQALFAFRALFATYASLRRAVDAGMIPLDDPDYVDAQAALQAAFDRSYIGRF